MSKTTEPETEEKEPPKRRIRKRYAAWRSLVASVVLLGAFAFAVLAVSFLALMGRNVALPDIAVSQIERQLNGQMGEETVSLEAVTIGLRDDALRPTFDLVGLEVFNAQGEQILALPKLRSKLDTSELLFGRFALETLELDGATMRMVRDPDGILKFGFGAQMGGGDAVSGSLADVMTAFDSVFDDPRLRELEEVRARNIRLELIDERDDRIIVIEDGAMSLVNGTPVVQADVRFAYTQDNGTPATLVLSLEKPKGADGARLRATFDDVSTRDLAGQLAALNWLEVLDAPVSGALSLELGEGAVVEALAGTLDIQKGVLKPAEQAKPVHFNSAKTYIRYESGTQRLYLDQISLDAPELRLKGEGHADLLDFASGIPQTLLAQLRISDVLLDPEGIFENPVSFAKGVFDVRYLPDEIKLDIGQVVLENEGAQIVAQGEIEVLEEGWAVALDANIGEIAPDRLLALWPTSAKENTRNWLTSNVQAGKLQDAAAGLRLVPGAPLQTSVTFNFQDATVRYLKSLPPVTAATGFASITGQRFFLQLDEGHIDLNENGRLMAAGSQMDIPKLRSDPVVARFDLKLNGTVETALALLDDKPFEFLKKSDLTPDIATGLAEIDAVLHVPFVKEVALADVGFAVDAQLKRVKSTNLVKDRVLEANTLRLLVDDDSLSIKGPATLDGIPVDLSWSRPIGPGSGKVSSATGAIQLSQSSLEAFNIGLPPGSVSGQAQGEFTLDLVRGEPPKLRLTSDLQGLGLKIDALGWRKPREQAGTFSVEAELGPTPDIKGLSIDVAGLSATGTVDLKPEGGFDRAVFSPLKVDDRLNSNVEVIGRGKGRPVALFVRGGSVDIRKFGVTDGKRGRGGGPLEMALDNVTVTDNITLTGFRGSFRNDRGLDGTFTARLNGKADLKGIIVPTDRGLAVRVQSADGGGILAASGIFRNGRGGEMDLTLQPNGKPGEFNGRLTISNIRVKKAPALADLLAAVSVVGLLEQLSGDGISFDSVEADFLLTSRGVSLKRSSAVGASMGITMEGIYDTVARRMDMQGVVSPIYVVNGLFGALFAPRKGEGLIGFNYGLTGSADNPRVQVNPLSALTPGIFREIFRQPVPKLSQ